MGKVSLSEQHLKLHVLCAGSVKSPVNACLVLQAACKELAGLENGLLHSMSVCEHACARLLSWCEVAAATRTQKREEGGELPVGSSIFASPGSAKYWFAWAVLSGACQRRARSLSCFLNLSCLCSLLDDISGTLPTSVLVGPMGSSLQSFPLPPPPPPHAPGQLSFSSKALAFPSGIWSLGVFLVNYQAAIWALTATVLPVLPAQGHAVLRC